MAVSSVYLLVCFRYEFGSILFGLSCCTIKSLTHQDEVLDFIPAMHCAGGW